MFFKNKSLYRRATQSPDELHPAMQSFVSVLIPARNEEASIEASLHSIIASTHPHLEVLVLDDHSEDRTADIVRSMAAIDPRIRLVPSATLPKGWNGKQHACWQLAQAATSPWLLFLDADVRLTPDAITRIVAEQRRSNAPLISGFPRQVTGTFGEKLLIPLMHYILLGYLPLEQLRQSTSPSFASGCGQLFFADREIYLRVDGHRGIQSSRHDGIQLPKLFRTHGQKTDLFDATDIATCRMYSNFSQVINGLLKNATEGIANVRLIVPFSILLLGGSVLPIALIITGLLYGQSWLWIAVACIAMILGWLPRIMAVRAFQQSVTGAALHPVSILMFIAIQWLALGRHYLGLKTTWRGRS